MILGLGVDVCPVDRIGDIIHRHGDIFTKRVFTDTEIAYAGSGVVRNERLAARWAAKEATIKALGAPDGLRWHDMEVTNTPGGAPQLTLKGSALQQAQARGMQSVHISLSHAGGVAMAVVIIEGATQ